MTEHTRLTRLDADAVDDAAVLAVIEDQLGVGRPRPDLRMTDSIRDDIDLDSLSMMEALTRVEDHYGIELIDDPDIGAVATVGDLVTLIQRVRAASGHS
ncbi:phosphopantetheine-binding protein [Nocardia sp. CDC159]|uniref:Phosphopantetheine-binding protein n=1 Tax=Nocardia pulmonis TaxID=2951408 RepID=A0A9X2IXS2_9NOCA|nr:MULTISPECIES: phosphopantetheine-binding protein [Nocardia]MCM6773141.1 phosphopantetheine-binding protein [Nocardia pulmonis]MCM6785556.1 phosphopantetheine-binding protein [Nocardia sp. CDC159]